MSPVRPASRRDAARCAEIYRPFVTGTAITFELEPPSRREFEKRMAGTPGPWLVYENAAGRVLGYAYAGKYRDRPAYRWSVDLAVYVEAKSHGRGVGRALYAALLRRLRTQGFVNAFAGIALPNPVSVGFHESFGFKRVGVYKGVGYKLGAWHDVGWWQLALRKPPAKPSEPRPRI